MRSLTAHEADALEIIRQSFGSAEALYTGEVGANLGHSNMDSTSPLTDYFKTEGIHDYSVQSVGPEHKLISECVIFDGRTTELAPMSFNRALSRKRNRFWIPALRRMALPDDVLAFSHDHGLVVVVNLTGVERHDPDFVELKALLTGPTSSGEPRAKTVAETPEGVPSQAGVRLSKAERDALEKYSRLLATQYFESLGWAIEPTFGSIPYDLVARKDGVTLYIEVKSSTGPAEAVILTYREVEHAREAAESALFIVSDIRLETVAGSIVATGGRRRLISPWKPAGDDLLALDYRYHVPAAAWLD